MEIPLLLENHDGVMRRNAVESAVLVVLLLSRLLSWAGQEIEVVLIRLGVMAI